MIVTVTPGPALDRTYQVHALRRGAVLRASGATVEASGKGVNVTRLLAARGVPTVAVLPVGGAEGRQLLELLDAAQVRYRAVRTAVPTRVNTTVLEPGGHTTKINAPAPPLTAADVDGLLAATADALADAEGTGSRWVVCAGSVPAGRPGTVGASAPPGTVGGSVLPGTIGRLVAAAREVGARVAVDTSSTALREALDANVDLVAPNVDELAELCGRSLDSHDEVAVAAGAVAAGSGAAVLVTLGADGAVLVDAGEVLHAVPPPIQPVNTAGAGDALLSGYLAADLRGAALVDRLAQAVAWGTTACLSAGTAEWPAERIDPAAVRVSARRRVGPLT